MRWILLFLAVLPACRSSSPEAAPENENWPVTAWSGHYEVFAETAPLVAGREAASHAHFTWLPDFSALNEGSVTGILRGEDGREESFTAPQPLRAGIFRVVFKPSREGEYDLVFRVRAKGRSEDIQSGRVRVGREASPGGLIERPAGAPDEAAAGAPPTGFLKEQQWRTAFATDWVRSGTVRQSLRAPGKVLPAAGGEAILTAPVDGVVGAARQWPHAGLGVERGHPLFTLAPRMPEERSLSEYSADAAALEAELVAARARLGRLQKLVAVQAASRQDLEDAEARVGGLAARQEAARRNRDAAEAARGPARTSPESFRLAAPIAGRVAEIAVSPGQFVAAGTPLGRLVRTSPVWLELALQPEQAERLAAAPAGLSVRRWAGEAPMLIPGGDLRLISRAPEVDPGTGTVAVILEVRRGVDVLRLGSRVEAEVLLAQELAGIAIPASALVDDSGVEVVYLQLGGESFERREVRVEARQGDLVLVRGLAAGERLVTRGAHAIRRSELLGSGAVEGHVH